MLQLIVNLDNKNHFASSESSSGRWIIYREKSGQRDKIEEKYFSSYQMESELELAIKALDKWCKNQ